MCQGGESMSRPDWTKIKESLASRLSPEETYIIDMLIARKSLVEIGRVLGQHRSMVWRKVERLKKRARETS